MTMTAFLGVELTSTQRGLWWGAIIGGFVVILAVVALLTTLVVLVRTIDRRVVQVRDTLRAAATNTADAALIPITADGVEAVLAEGLEHHLFLGRVLGKVRS
jgi:Ca2+/Na+ antiporter